MATHTHSALVSMLAGDHPWIIARDGFMAGSMHSTTAVGLICKDPQFRAECEMNSKDLETTARAVVDHVWRRELINKLTGKPVT